MWYSHQRKHCEKLLTGKKKYQILCMTPAFWCNYYHFLNWLVLCKCWSLTSFITVVMYYMMAQENITHWCFWSDTQLRHYNISEIMQYEPQSATYDLLEKYLLTWLIAAGWIDESCIIYLRRLYKYCILTEGCLKLDSVRCPWRRTVWQFHFLYFMFRLWYDRLFMMILGC